jgi:hypothetical protein
MLVIVQADQVARPTTGSSARKLVPSSKRRIGLSRSILRTPSSATEVAMTVASRASRDRNFYGFAVLDAKTKTYN